MKVGILGGGQLARMMAEAGLPLGLEFVIVDPNADACAGGLGEFVCTAWDDAKALRRLADCDRVTCDFENVPAGVLDRLAEAVQVRPSAGALAAAQDRLVEKRRFVELDIPTVGFEPVSSRSELAAAIDRLGYPAVLKTRRLGYDGKGQEVLRGPEDLEPAWQVLGDHELILEQWIAFDYECAITAVRGEDGELRCWPVSRTWHRDGILRLAGPLPVSDAVIELAESHVRRLAESLDYIGCLTLELFVDGDRLLANEFAPRVHNSAHWTIEGAACSQFENHLRAVCGLPLGETRAREASMMLNFIGTMPDRAAWLGHAGVRWHDYGKSARVGRKVGHATVIAPDAPALAEALESMRELYPEPQLGEVIKAA
ncbi:MAG: 5-(carboxyamino)imidazole ribonucleotide synthase, partial [Wenzhouxiangellaceae bacterium]